ncbi:MAG: hypothetical protein ACI3ZO_07355 [Candidatus Cryptobacteroides sp.]|nr:hypothetical protein [Bacteroidales bacterium]
MRKIIAIFIALLPLAGTLSAKGRERETRIMGTPMSVQDTSSNGRRLAQRLFISKGEVGLGVSFSYLDIDSNNSDVLMLLQNCNAYAKTFSVAPMISYAVRDNKAIGVRFKYTTSSGNISDSDLSLLSEDLTLNVEDIRASGNTYQTAVFYRSCMGLDDKGRFGLFTDVQLAYTHGRTSFSYGDVGLNAYTLSDKLKLSLHPGLEVFVMNNISMNVSIGIGGARYTNIRCMEDGHITGRRNAGNARFYLDVTDIRIGVTIHI